MFCKTEPPGPGVVPSDPPPTDCMISVGRLAERSIPPSYPIIDEAIRLGRSAFSVPYSFSEAVAVIFSAGISRTRVALVLHEMLVVSSSGGSSRERVNDLGAEPEALSVSPGRAFVSRPTRSPVPDISSVRFGRLSVPHWMPVEAVRDNAGNGSDKSIF